MLSALFLLGFPTSGLASDPQPKVRNIYIKVSDIFEGESQSGFYRTVNHLKANTKESVIAQELLISKGDIYDKFLLEESERALRQLSFLRKVSINPYREGEFVDLYVDVQDTWTLFPQFIFSTGSGSDRKAVGIVEGNLFGYGKRLEALWSDDEGRETIEGVWEDRRLLGSHQNLLIGHFERSDGYRSVASYGSPFRSLVEKSSWKLQTDFYDLVGKLYAASEESFIFRKRHSEFGAGYTMSFGDPEVQIKRFTLGYSYSKDIFGEADGQDFVDVDIDPDSVSRDPQLIADNREFSGPFASLSVIHPNFISANYIDRFERVEDFNLGLQWGGRLHFAGHAFGSEEDSLGNSLRLAHGWSFSNDEFFRTEFFGSSRLNRRRVDNALMHLGLRYYNVLGAKSAGDIFLGKHTLAFSLKLSHAENMDRDSQFLLGAGDGLRGYDSRTFFGDSRMILSLEDRISFAENVFQLLNVGSAFFLDVGGAGKRGFGDLIDQRLYADIGLGLRFGFPRSSGGSVLRVDLAVPLRDGPDGSEAFEPRVIVTTGQAFSASLRKERRNVVQTESVLGP